MSTMGNRTFRWSHVSSLRQLSRKFPRSSMLPFRIISALENLTNWKISMLFTCPQGLCDIFTWYRPRYPPRGGTSHTPSFQVNKPHLFLARNALFLEIWWLSSYSFHAVPVLLVLNLYNFYFIYAEKARFVSKQSHAIHASIHWVEARQMLLTLPKLTNVEYTTERSISIYKRVTYWLIVHSCLESFVEAPWCYH